MEPSKRFALVRFTIFLEQETKMKCSLVDMFMVASDYKLLSYLPLQATIRGTNELFNLYVTFLYLKKSILVIPDYIDKICHFNDESSMIYQKSRINF